MSELLTVQQLLEKNSSQDAGDHIFLSLEADLLLTDAALTEIIKPLKADPSITTIEVISQEGNTLGYLSRKAILDYLSELMDDLISAQQSMGGNISRLEGMPLTVPRFRCSIDHAPRELIVTFGSQLPVACPACGRPMTLVE
jgi:hypothetical protein